MADLWNPVLSSSGWSAPTPTDTSALRTSTAGLTDAALGSRSFANPLAGRRQAVAVGSVYQHENVPAFLSQAVSQLNEVQAQRAAQQEAYRQSLLSLYSGPNAYLVAPALAAAAVKPGTSVTLGGQGLFENPIVGQAKSEADTAASSAANIVTNEIDRRQRTIQDLRQQMSTAWGPSAEVTKGALRMRIADEERALKDLQNSQFAKGVSGWVGTRK